MGILEDGAEDLLPERTVLGLLALATENLDRDGVLATGGDVDLVNGDEASSLDKLVGEVEDEHNDGNRDERLEEALCSLTGSERPFADGEDGSVEGEADDKEVEETAENGAPHAERRLPGKLLESVAVPLPCHAGTGVGNADAHPGDDGRETRNGEQPVEDLATRIVAGVDEEAEGTENEREDDGGQRSALSVNVGEDRGSLANLGHGAKGTASSVDSRVTDRENRDEDDGVHDARQNVNTCVGDGNDEGRGTRIVRSRSKTLLSVRDNGGDDEERDDVEDDDTGKNLLGSLGNLLAGVGGLGSSKADELGTGVREGSGDKDRGETLEAIVERTRVRPGLGTVVSAVGTTTAVDDDTANDETDDSENLDERTEELELSVASNTEEVDDGDNDQEEGYPDTPWYRLILVPVGDDNGCGDEFEGKDDEPLEPVVVSHGETDSRVDETGRVGSERSGNREDGSKFTEGHDDHEKHNTDENKVNHEETGTTVGESTTGANEETSTDRTTEGDELDVSAVKATLETALIARSSLGGVGDARLKVDLLARALLNVVGATGERVGIRDGGLEAVDKVIPGTHDVMLCACLRDVRSKLYPRCKAERRGGEGLVWRVDKGAKGPRKKRRRGSKNASVKREEWADDGVRRKGMLSTG